jgi:hypothetical protein
MLKTIRFIKACYPAQPLAFYVSLAANGGDKFFTGGRDK